MESTVLALLGLLLLKVPPNSCQSALMMTSHERIFRKLFTGPRADVLSTLPLCHPASSQLAGSDYAAESNMTWPEYSASIERRGAISVKMGVQLYQLAELNEKSQTVTMVIAIHKRWNDCRLGWRSADFNNYTTFLHVDPRKFRALYVFTPVVELVEATNPKDADDAEKHVRIMPNGDVIVTLEFSTRISCKFDISMYPYDLQTCKLTFQSDTTADTSRLSTHGAGSSAAKLSKMYLGRYTPSDQWTVTILPPEVQREGACSDGSNRSACFHEVLSYTMLLRRHPNYQLINLFIPAFLIVLISGCIFIIPPGGGDKMGLSVSNLLALYMFSQLMYEKMPETGSTVPLLSRYFLMCIGLASASCLYAAVSSVFSSACPRVPPAVCKFVKTLGAILLFDLNKPKGKSNDCEKQAATVAASVSESPKMLPLTADVEVEESQWKWVQSPNECQTAALCQRRICESEKFGIDLSKDEEITWLTVGALLDRCFFLLHMIITSVAVAYFFSEGYGQWASYGVYGKNKTIMEFVCEQSKLQLDMDADEICKIASNI